MPARYISRQSGFRGAQGLPTAAPFIIDSNDSNKVKVIPAGSGTTAVEVVDASSTQTLTNKTFTSPTLTTPTITSPVVVDATEVVIATNLLTAAESGKTMFLSAATEFVTTLPAVAAGLWFRFIIAAAPSGADYTIVSAAADTIIGQVYASAGTDEDSEVTAGASTITFTAAAGVIGDSLDIYCDGTLWYARGFCNATGGITFTG